MMQLCAHINYRVAKDLLVSGVCVRQGLLGIADSLLVPKWQLAQLLNDHVSQIHKVKK